MFSAGLADGASQSSAVLSQQLSAPVVSSDRTRKWLLGVDAQSNTSAQAFGGSYSARFSERVYRELLRRGASVVTSGRPVILDASFRSRELRSMVRLLAQSYDVPFYFVECRASVEHARERLQRRAEGCISDARADLLDEFAARFEAVTELEPIEHVALDTTLSMADTRHALQRRLPAWPSGLTA